MKDTCPRDNCNGTLFPEENPDDNSIYLHCNLCERNFRPVPPRKGTKRERHEYFEKYKTDIIHDLHELGEDKMLKRWHIPLATWKSGPHDDGTYSMGLFVRWIQGKPKDTGESQEKATSHEIKINLTRKLTKPALSSAKRGSPVKIKQKAELNMPFLQTTITERDLALLPETDFFKFWENLGRIIRARGIKAGMS